MTVIARRQGDNRVLDPTGTTMPYILAADRAKLKPAADAIVAAITADTVAGDLNYLISLMAKAYIDAKGLRYEHLNAVVGALDSCKAEFQRRVVGPYEDKKIAENGDVYGELAPTSAY